MAKIKREKIQALNIRNEIRDITTDCTTTKSSQMMLVVKNLPAIAGAISDVGLTPALGRSLEKGMATHYGILVWRILWTEEPSGLPSMGSQSHT